MSPLPYPLVALVLAMTLALSPRAHGQLAITEVMSAPQIDPLTGLRGPEYWELTNFSTNEVNLDGYAFRDSVPTRPLVRDPFTNLVLRAGESLILFRVSDPKDSVTDDATFRAWWGDAQLPPNLRFRIWRSPGLSGWDGDAVWLFDPLRRLVDVVEFGRARIGRAFVSAAESGRFGVFSVDGVDGAFTAALAQDVGSPGYCSVPVPLRIVQQPSDRTVDAGMSTTFAVEAVGLPRPKYQWFANELLIPGASAPELLLPHAQSTDSGTYRVWVSNGISTVASVVARLTVRTNPSPPGIEIPPANLTVFDRQTAIFRVTARGLPAPAYQWQANGVEIFGANGPVLEVPDATRAMSGTIYSVRISNPLGTTNASALLTVTRRPDLRFTEVMARPFDEEGNRHFDWFELTNFDPEEVSLLGWRIADEPSLASAFTITNAITLQPGESMVFAERLDAGLFARWWGEDNLPPGLKVCAYGGFGLGYLGEQLSLWDAGAVDAHDPIATVSWAAATLGVSFECEHWCDPEGYGCLDEATKESVLGVQGAFRAASGQDLGSPGSIANPPLRILRASRGSDGVHIYCRVVPGLSYRLWRAASLVHDSWQAVETKSASNNLLTFDEPSSSSATATSFYKVEELPR
jgi:hypothetical protein